MYHQAHLITQTLYFESPYPAHFLRWAFLPSNTEDFFGVFKEVTGPDGMSYLRPLRCLDMGLVVFGCSVVSCPPIFKDDTELL